MEKQTSEGYLINGKAQVIEMLKLMTDKEKQVLLLNIRKRNPQLAEELFEGSISFDIIMKLSDVDLKRVMNYIQASIMGLTLKELPKEFQRRVLGLAERKYAEQAFEILTRPVAIDKKTIQRAANKTLKIISELAKKKQINI